MMPPLRPGPRVQAELGGREDPLPAPFAVCVGIFSLQPVRQIDSAEALRYIVLVQQAYVFEMRRKRFFHGDW